MRQWTAEERARQAELIKRWQPWTKGGVKTGEGKRISSQNALKHGLYTARARQMRRSITLCRRRVLLINLLIKLKKREMRLQVRNASRQRLSCPATRVERLPELNRKFFLPVPVPRRHVSRASDKRFQCAEPRLYGNTS